MNKSIDKIILEKFRTNYKNPQNISLQNRFKNEMLLDVCLNQAVIDENKFEFNIELEDCKIYDQHTSLRCWLYSCLNLIKNDIAHNLNMSPMEFELSANYLSFYDKLEKSNHAYQTIIDYDGEINNFNILDYDNHRFLSEFLKEPAKENGRIEYARELVKKYGIVPYQVMPDNYNTKDSAQLIKLFLQKVRVDLYKLIEAKKAMARDLLKIKETLLQENYNLLCNLIGEPPVVFDYTYKDVNDTTKDLQSITPLQFYKKYSSLNLDDFILIGNVPQKSKPYFKKYRKAYSGNIQNSSYVEFINIPQDMFTELCITQLKNNLPVCFACENQKYRNKESKILDTRIFDFEKLLGVEDLTKEQALDSFDISLKHWMTFRGVHIENNKPIRWKVEDSAGSESRINGYYIMNHNFFEKCVFQAWIHKKFLSKEVLEINKTKPVLFGYNDSV